MFLKSTFYLIGETLIHLAARPAAPLAGRTNGWMGVFPLGENEMEQKIEACKKEVVLLVDNKNKVVYDLTPIADEFHMAIGNGNIITDLKEIASDMAFNFLQIASQNKNETIGENILEVAYDIHLMRLFEKAKPIPGKYGQYEEFLTIENMACRTDQ